MNWPLLYTPNDSFRPISVWCQKNRVLVETFSDSSRLVKVNRLLVLPNLKASSSLRYLTRTRYPILAGSHNQSKNPCSVSRSAFNPVIHIRNYSGEPTWLGVLRINMKRWWPFFTCKLFNFSVLGSNFAPIRIHNQCCGSGSGIRCLFDPWNRDPG
jgi:hypothetical protein